MVQVLVLAVGGLYLATSWPGRLEKWQKLPLWIAVAALLGIPLTAGFLGLSGLYDSQLTTGQPLLAILIAAAIIPVMASAILLVLETGRFSRATPLSRIDLAILLLALTLPALGVLGVSGVFVSNGNLASWGLIFLTALGASALSWYATRTPEIRQDLRWTSRASLPLESIRRFLSNFATGASHFFREAAAILEGEGGMLWLLVLVVVLWLARVA